MNKGSVGRASYVIGAEVSAISDGGESDSPSHLRTSLIWSLQMQTRACQELHLFSLSRGLRLEDCL